VCSASIVFDPEDITKPVLRWPMRGFRKLGKYERGTLIGKNSAVFEKCFVVFFSSFVTHVFSC
jgi:hypothetical protein